MNGPTVPGIVFIATVVISVLFILIPLRRWRRGRRDGVFSVGSLFLIPKRYLVDVHDVVVRHKPSSRMHVMAAGGVVLCVFALMIAHVFGVGGTVPLALLFGACIMIAIGAFLVLCRRYPARLKRLSGGQYTLLAPALLSFSVFYAIGYLIDHHMVPFGWSSAWGILLLAVGIFGTSFLMIGMTTGVMRHAFAGALHLAVHPRPGRFKGEAQGYPKGLKPLDLHDDVLGVKQAEDFSWRQLVSFDACVQCGRCEDVCPAFAAGSSLNPKTLVYQLWEASCRGEDVIQASGLSADQIWSCTTCRSCVAECPMMIEHVDAIIDIRRFETLEQGASPGKAPDLLESLHLYDNQTRLPAYSRMAWASDLNIPVAQPHQDFDVLVWMGEGAFDPRHQKVLRSLIRILRDARVDFAVLGEAEIDIADTARRLGDEALFDSATTRIIDLLDQYSFNKILTTDPHVLNCFKNDYPAFGANYTVLHHTTFIAQLLAEQRIAFDPSTAIDRSQSTSLITYHDPCYLGRYNDEYEAPRSIIQSLGYELVEMERSRRRSFCCGGGGGVPITDIPMPHRIPDLRIEQAKSTGADIVITACPNCTNMFEGVSGQRPIIMDVAELLGRAMGENHAS